MQGGSEGFGRLRRIFDRHAEEEVATELAFHLEMRVRDLEAQGMTPEAARQQALRAFGDVDAVARECRSIARRRNQRLRRRDWLGELRRDAAYGVRQLRRNRAFAGVAVLTLALGIGANTAIFSAVDQVILRPLPFADPERLVMLWEENPEKGWYEETAAPANFLDWREQVPAFADVAAYTDHQGRVTLTEAGEPQVLGVATVTGNFFSVLGVRPALGRTLRGEETWKGAEPVVVISHRAWVQRFGADPGVIGRSVRLDGRPFQIVGVMPAGFAFPGHGVDLWRPFAWDPASRSEVWFRRAHWLRAVARLQPGVPIAEADAQLQTVVRRLQEQYPETNRLMGAGLTPLHTFLVGDARTPLLVLLGAVGLLLLLACANVGNLLLARTAARQREVAVRSALGAGRLRIARQMLVESLILSAAGGAVGLLLGWGGVRLLSALRPAELAGPGALSLDARVLGYTAVITVASGLLFGLAPTLWSAHARLGDALKAGDRCSGPGRSTRRTASVLVAIEVALALLLVVGAGLLVRSLWRLQLVDPGFDPTGVLAVSLSLPGIRYDNDEKRVAFYQELVRRAEALPGVQSAAAVSQLPLAGVSWTSDFAIAGRGPDEYGTEVAHREVSPGYFRTMRVPLLRGRTFSDADGAGRPFVVVINEALARAYFPGQDPIGQRLTFDRVPDGNSVWRTIVGVVGSEHQASLAEPPRIEIYAPFPQEAQGAMSLLLRTRGEPAAFAPAVRRVLAELDPSVAPYEVRTMEAVRSGSVARQRFLMTLLLLFGGIALVLAVVGIYGVVAQMVRQRTREIGIRLAIGARPSDVRRLVVRHGLLLVSAGLLIGLPLVLLAARAMRALLYETQPADPATLAVVALLLGIAGVSAAYVPALRASRTEPATVLRAE